MSDFPQTYRSSPARFNNSKLAFSLLFIALNSPYLIDFSILSIANFYYFVNQIFLTRCWIATSVNNIVKSSFDCFRNSEAAS